MKQFILLILIFLSFPAIAADKRFSNEIPKLNRDVILSKVQFDNATKLVQEKPLNDESVAFRVRLPTNWNKLNTGNIQGVGDEMAVGELVRYLGPAYLDKRSSFTVKSFNLDFTITAKNWFMNYVSIQNLNLQGLEEADDSRVQAHYVTIDNGNTYVVRAVAQISGSKLVLAEYSVPIEAWKEERDLAIWGMASFVLTTPDRSPIEKINEYAFLDIAKFKYPNSWVIAPEKKPNIERMTVVLANIKGQQVHEELDGFKSKNALLDARIDILVVAKASGATLSAEAQALKDSLLQKGFVLGDLIESQKDWKVQPAVQKNFIESYKIADGNSRLANYEEWVGLFETADHIYVVSLLTLGRDENFGTWIRNVEAYKMVVATLGPAA